MILLYIIRLIRQFSFLVYMIFKNSYTELLHAGHFSPDAAGHFLSSRAKFRLSGGSGFHIVTVWNIRRMRVHLRPAPGIRRCRAALKGWEDRLPEGYIQNRWPGARPGHLKHCVLLYVYKPLRPGACLSLSVRLFMCLSFFPGISCSRVCSSLSP